MVDQTLVDYLKEQIKAGYNINRLKTYLVKNGYSSQEVEEAANSITASKQVRHVVHHVSRSTIILPMKFFSASWAAKATAIPPIPRPARSVPTL